MFSRCVFASLVAGAVVVPAPLWAQQWPAPPPPAKNMDRLPRAQVVVPEVEELTPKQIERAQEKDSAPEPTPVPRPAAPKKAEKTAKKQAPKHREPTHAVACSGSAFVRTSSQVRLEGVYKAQNVAFTQVDGANGSKVMATVLFPKDPKQRLEVWWSDEEKRRDIYLIVINGQSAWVAPRGVKLGLNLAALERINHKPFKLKGFDNEGSQVSDWNGGALARLPGGCKVGVRLRADPEVAPKMRAAAAGNKEFASSDAAIRAVKPVIAEIILGY